MYATRPRTGKTTYHRDDSVTIWDIYEQGWRRTSEPSDALLATLPPAERDRVRQHCCQSDDE